MAKGKGKPGAGVVSACLLGRPCRFDGKDKFTPGLAFLLEGRHVIAVCPEELGGLGTPRPACGISGGDGADVLDGKARVIDVDGNDRTDAFVNGARAGLEIALAGGAREAVLKERSPSCGVTSVYRGDATGPGQGVFTALLARNGIPAVNESRAIRRKPRRSD